MAPANPSVPPSARLTGSAPPPPHQQPTRAGVGFALTRSRAGRRAGRSNDQRHLPRLLAFIAGFRPHSGASDGTEPGRMTAIIYFSEMLVASLLAIVLLAISRLPMSSDAMLFAGGVIAWTLAE
jgi:hypothetical protein